MNGKWVYGIYNRGRWTGWLSYPEVRSECLLPLPVLLPALIGQKQKTTKIQGGTAHALSCILDWGILMLLDMNGWIFYVVLGSNTRHKFNSSSSPHSKVKLNWQPWTRLFLSLFYRKRLFWSLNNVGMREIPQKPKPTCTSLAKHAVQSKHAALHTRKKYQIMNHFISPGVVGIIS